MTISLCYDSVCYDVLVTLFPSLSLHILTFFHVLTFLGSSPSYLSDNKRGGKEKVNFADFKSLHPQLLERLKDLGFEKPLPVQHQTLEATLRGQ